MGVTEVSAPARAPRELSPLRRRLASVRDLPRYVLALTAVASLGALLLVLVAGGPAWALVLGALAPWALVLARELAFGQALRRSNEDWLRRAFPSAPAPVLAEQLSRVRTMRFRAGDVVVAEGEPADRFYIITSGEVEASQSTPEGDVYLRTLGPGEFFGEVGLLTSAPRTATVRAVCGLELLSLEQDDFRRVVEGSQATAEDLQRVLEDRSVPAMPREDAVPMPPWTRLMQRIFKHPRAMHYNRLIALVIGANALLALYGLTGAEWWKGFDAGLGAVAVIAQANIALAIILRQQYVINFLGWIATKPPVTWPLRLRWALGKYYHFGGLHVGAAVSGTLWYLAFVGLLIYGYADGRDDVGVANVVVSSVIVTLLAVMIVMALPRYRAAAHDNFEVTHRFCGWAALALVWLNTVLFVTSRADGSALSALLSAPTIWLLLVTTVCAAWPWMLLRRVPISVTRPSSHVAVVKLDHGVTPGVGTTRAISRSPFYGWHHFANVPASADSPGGYRMTISRAGDWTSDFIDEPPEFVWVRGIPTIGVVNVKKLFEKVVYVVTGSGIGPALGHLLAAETPSQLVWSTRDPRQTYGPALLEEILTAQPDAVIWNTDELGKPDMLRLAYGAYVSSGAEAVICISNRKVTWRVVHGLERRGIPAFGPIWDS